MTLVVIVKIVVVFVVVAVVVGGLLRRERHFECRRRRPGARDCDGACKIVAGGRSSSRAVRVCWRGNVVVVVGFRGGVVQGGVGERCGDVGIIAIGRVGGIVVVVVVAPARPRRAARTLLGVVGVVVKA